MVVSRPYLMWVVVALLLVLVMPLVVMLGMMALGMASGGMMAQMNDMMRGDLGPMATAFAVMWALLVSVALLAVIALLVRYAARA